MCKMPRADARITIPHAGLDGEEYVDTYRTPAYAYH